MRARTKSGHTDFTKGRNLSRESCRRACRSRSSKERKQARLLFGIEQVEVALGVEEIVVA